jgi:hypothetical protein
MAPSGLNRGPEPRNRRLRARGSSLLLGKAEYISGQVTNGSAMCAPFEERGAGNGCLNIAFRDRRARGFMHFYALLKKRSIFSWEKIFDFG